MRTALLIAAKDLRQRMRDRSALLVALVLPLALASIFGLILHDVGSGRTTFHYALVDLDRGAAAQAFSAHVLAPLEREGLLDLRREGSVSDGRRLADRGTVSAAIVIPRGFSAAVAGGRPARIDVLGNVDSTIGSLVAESIARSYGARIDGVRIATATAGGSRQAAALAAAAERPIAIQDVSTQTKELDGTTFYAAGMAVFFLFFTVQLGVTSLFDERRDGTLARMLAAPVQHGAILVGKLLTSVALGIVSMVVLAVATHLAARRALGRSARRRAADRRGRARGDGRHGARGHAGPDARPGAVVGLDGRARARHARRLVLPDRAGRRRAGGAQPRLAARLVPARPAGALRRRERERSARPGGGDPRLRRRGRRPRGAARQAPGGAVKALAIAATDLRRLLRWRANVFFLFLLPMLIILLLGAAFGGSSARIGVVGGTGGLGHRLVTGVEAQRAVEVRRFAGERDLERAVARGRVDAGLVVPGDYDARVTAGRAVTLRYFGRPDSSAQQLAATVQAVAADEGAVLGAAQLAARERGEPFPRALARASATAAHVPRVTVALTAPDGAAYPRAEGRFESGASTQLLLFVFLNSLNGAVWLIETRRLGIVRRMLSTPTSRRSILGGVLLGRLAIALLQALIIVIGSSLLFGVGWGDPLGTTIVVLAFCLVGTGAGMLLGAVCSTEQQAGPIALLLGLALAAFGGSMVPLEVFPSSVRSVAHLTPHAWANDAFSKLLQHGAGAADVLPQVAVLLAFAGVAIGLATWQLRRGIVA